MQKFEYMEIVGYTGTDDFIVKLNELGADGWEAVNYLFDPWKNYRVLLKRRVS